jgi:signal transduction histidine kinase
VLIEEQQQTLTVAGDDTTEVEIDGSLLRQVLTNLIDNADKYCNPGGRIAIRVASVERKTVSVEVEDNGPGIPERHRDKVFDRFYRVDEARSRETGGVGLGLAIAKWGVEAHGGHLELYCPIDSGCIFRLVLPSGHPSTHLKDPSEAMSHVS